MKALDKDREELNTALRHGIFHLQNKGYTYRQIGTYMGYPKGSARARIGQIVNEGSLPSAVKLVRLSRLLSEEGFDDVADLFSAPTKATVPVGAPHDTNLSLDEEIREIIENLGPSSEAFRTRRIREAECRARALVAGSHHFYNEVMEAKRAWLTT